MVPFGFSAGDFAIAIGLIVRISKALRDSGGAAAEYRDIIQDLRNLQQLLELLETVRPADGSVSHVNAIRGIALACRTSLLEFAEKIERYEQALGSGSSKGMFKRVVKKVQWAILGEEEVAKFRGIIAAKVYNIALLLGAFNSDALSKMESQHRDDQNILLEQMDNNKDFVASHLSELSHTHHGALATELSHVERNIREDVSNFARETRVGHNELIERSDKQMHELKELSRQLHQIHKQLLSVKEQQAGTQSQISIGFRSVLNEFDLLGALGRTVFSRLVPFTETALKHLRKNRKANIEIYALLLKIQTSIAQDIFPSRQYRVHFKDVLGRKKLLPYDYFRHWDIFNSMLRCKFKGLPGEQKVIGGDYVLLDRRVDGVTIGKETWQHMVFPETKIRMSVVLETFEVVGGICPRPNCPGIVEISAKNPVVHCPEGAPVSVHAIADQAQPPRLAKSEHEPQQYLGKDEPLKAQEPSMVHETQSPTPTEKIRRPIKSCKHHWKRIKATSEFLQWHCQHCHSGPHWLIQQCQKCEARYCRKCAIQADSILHFMALAA